MDNINKTARKTGYLYRNPIAGALLFVLCTFADCVFTLPAMAAEVAVPVTTDSRIKTFVYNENDVFNIVTHYGYQSNIEFSAQEDIETISVGDRVPFQIIPSGRRLFIRALTSNARTNMTVITNRHAYQFDIAAVPAPVMPNEELVYVVRFFYPDDKKNGLVHRSDMNQLMDKPSYDGSGNLINKERSYNYKYTFSGSDAIAPVKVFDDGMATSFKFHSLDTGNQIRFYIIDSSGKETFVNARPVGDYMVVGQVAGRFALQKGEDFVSVYNENLPH